MEICDKIPGEIPFCRFPEHSVYEGIKQRCFNKNHDSYYQYGGRGITVCDRWLGPEGFKNFYTDMGPRPGGRTSGGFPEYSIERINNNGNYEPGNCKWATLKEQSRNKSRNRFVDYEGKKITISELSEITGVADYVINYRDKKGISGTKLLEPVEDRKKYLYKGKAYTLMELVQISGLSIPILSGRINKYNWEVDRAVETPLIEIPKYEFEGEMLPLSEISKRTGVHHAVLRKRAQSGAIGKDLVLPKKSPKEYEDSGRTYTVASLVELTGLNEVTIRARLRKGMTVREILETPLRHKKINFFGEELTVEEISKRTKISKTTLKRRLDKGFTDYALIAPVKGSGRNISDTYISAKVFENSPFTSLEQLSSETGIHIEAIKNRYKLYGTLDEITNPPSCNYTYIWKGNRYSISELSEISGIKYSTLRSRLKKGWPIEKSMQKI